MAGWPPHKSIEESRKRLDRFMSNKKTFALEYQGKVIGSCGLADYNGERYPELALLNGREIGYVLSKDYRGRGLMPEAEYLFEVEKPDFIIADALREMRNRQE